MRDDYQPWEVKRQAMIKKPEEMQRATGRMDHLTTFKAIQDSSVSIGMPGQFSNHTLPIEKYFWEEHRIRYIVAPMELF